jgi:hypothetical protein
MRKVLTALALGVGLAFGGVNTAEAQTTVGDGLVNVAIGDVTILENVNVTVAAQIAAAICANLDLDAAVAVLAGIDFETGPTELVCRIGRSPQDLQITQNN